ncbi:MAG TPA: hypothetical protein VGD99_20635 [Anaerolineae bacterium]|jgi:hypothetical protein
MTAHYQAITDLHQPFDNKTWAEHQASQLYQRACAQPLFAQIRSVWRGHSNRLLELATVQANSSHIEQRYEGTKQVSLDQIRGSGGHGRSRDFDADFRPLNSHSRSRWLSVATARQLGTKLPPVSLVQVGDIYFVEDGHHRISVANALGLAEIEATVTVWQVSKPVQPQAIPAVS